MKIFQPMLFVGLGGTGGLIGAELERRLRAELCGPDGMRLTAGGRTRLPYQLPNCLQFVYADYSEAELTKLPHLSAPRSLRPALEPTARATHDLLPTEFTSSPDVTRMLRAVMRPQVSSWLPPAEGEPKVYLVNGAGQMPTVGRAALFATLRRGPEPVVEPLRRAIDAIGLSEGELQEMGGGPVNGCDVFVAFSVAGGTGAGIFLDYLHLIGRTFAEKGMRATIYPLVVMPSAFPIGKGGGREAELNASRALVDLSRLVDEQNVPDVQADLGDTGLREALYVEYPQMQPFRLEPGMVPTAFLFSRTAGIRPDDLRRSIVSLVTSLVGTELTDAPGTDHDDQTFASNFVNHDLARRERSATGIGHRGISTSLVASMTAPLNELAELISARMLALAVRKATDQSTPDIHPDAAALIRETFTAAGIGEVWRREALPVPEPDTAPKGGGEIEQALRDRLEEMQRLLEELERQLGQKVPKLADSFEPRAAAVQLLDRLDVFALAAILQGSPSAPDPVIARGFLGMLENRRQDPARPGGVQVQPPLVPRIRGRLGGMSRPRWGDEEVVAVIEEQDRWYQWRARVVWHRAWNEQEQRWRPKADDLQQEIVQLVDAYRKHLVEEPKAYATAVKELYDVDRAGVSYLLPPQRDLRDFYEDLMDRLIEREKLGASVDELTLIRRLVRPEQWRESFAIGEREPENAVAGVKTILQERVQRLFEEGGTQQRARPLLPSMGTLLSAAAGNSAAEHQVSQPALAQFTYKLASLLPTAFTPEGNGRLRILITYPSAQGGKKALEDYLGKALHLPRDNRREIIFRSVDTQTITVVLFRSEMSLTEIRGAREVLRQWANASEERRSEDGLRWRQRLGYQDDWLASTATDRVHILHRLLCAMWNGQIDYQGDAGSPVRVRVRLHEQIEAQAPAMTLTLGDYRDDVSSWAALLRCYERWALLGGEKAVEEYCRVLMKMLPNGLRTSGSAPSPLYLQFMHEVAPRQLALLEARERRYGGVTEWSRPLREFWTETLPAALELPFPGMEGGVQSNLRELEEWVAMGRSGSVQSQLYPADTGRYGNEAGPYGAGAGPYGNGAGRSFVKEPQQPDRSNGTGAGTAPAGGGPGYGPVRPADGTGHNGWDRDRPAGPPARDAGAERPAPPRPPAVPKAGRRTPAPEPVPGYPSYPESAPPDPAWSDESAPAWGTAGSDGEGDWDSTGTGGARDPWEGDPE
jgi:hypothetical protein